jgi:uncharacterized protein YjbI with pentapeptide repeats
MADEKLLPILASGVLNWNHWRQEHKGWIDLNGAWLHGIDLQPDQEHLKGHVTRLSGIDLRDAELARATLESCDLSGALLSGSVLVKANLRRANLAGADLRDADLYEADLYQANLEGADLSNARLTRARLVEANLAGANLQNSNIYGIAAWDIALNETTVQKNLVITDPSRTWEPEVAVDDLEVAQFVYLLLNRRKLRNVLETITSKTVLILGRFTPERKAVLEAIAGELRRNKLIPIIFDFERIQNRDFTETIRILAGMSLFVVADLTRPRSVPQELTATIPDYRIPFVPVIQEGEQPYAMLDDFKKYDWLLQPVLAYKSADHLVRAFRPAVIERAWKKHLELQQQKNTRIQTESIDTFMQDPPE